VTSGAALVRTGITHYNAGRYLKAIESFDRVLRHDPLDKNIALFLTQALRHAAGERGASKLIRTLIRKRGRSPGLLLCLGQILEKEGGAASARDAYRRAAAADRGLAGIEAEFRLGRFSSGFRAADRWMAGATYERLEGLLGVFEALGAEERFLRGLRRLRKGRPAGPWPRFVRVFLLYRYGLKGESVDGLLRGLRVDGGRDWMRFVLAKVRLHFHCDYAGAEADFVSALESVPALWHARAYTAEVALCRGDKARCFEMMDALVRGLGGIRAEEARAWRGEMYLWLGRRREAVRDLSQAARGNAPMARCWLGAVYYRLGEPERGLKELNVVLKENAGDLEAMMWRGEVLRVLGRDAAARKDLESVLAREPNYFWAEANLGLILASQGDAQGFRRAYNAVPKPVLRYFAGTAGKGTPKGPGLLKAGLEARHGVRRFDHYLYPIWMK